VPTSWGSTASPTPRPVTRTNHSRLFSALAATTAAALLTLTSGIGTALAAPGDTANATGQFLSGNLFALPLSAVIDLGGSSASNDGTQGLVVDSDDIDLTALNAVNVQIPGGIQLPLDIAQVGVVSQYAAANEEGASLGASGAVGDQGQIGVDAVPGQVPGDLNLSLSGVVGSLGLNPALLNELANLNLTVGAVSAQATQQAPNPAAGDYEIADLDLSFASPTVASLTGIINTTVATLQTQLTGVETALETVIRNLAGIGALATVDATVTVPPLTNAVTTLLTTPISSGGVTIDLTTGTVTVDLAVLNDLNNLPPNTNVLSAAQITAITDNITSLIAGLVTSVGNALQTTINGTAVIASASLLGLPLLSISTTLGNLLTGNVSGITLLGGLTIPGGVAALVGLLVAPILSTTNLGNVVALLSPLVINPVANLVIPAIAPVLNAVISLTANVQSTAGGVFTETALRVAILPLTPTPLIANLATATVGPNALLPDPVVTVIDPASGPDAGGTPVTLTGTNFAGTPTVTIGGAAVTPTSVTDTTITFVTPPHAAGIVDVVVNAPQGNSAPVLFEYLAFASATTSIDPVEGTEAGGTPVTITGSGFTGATDVTFDGVSATDVVVVNDTTITATTPLHAPGPVNVEVVDPVGNSGPLAYTYLAVASAAASLTPTVGPVVGGTPVTITGSGFLGATGVTFDGTLGTDFAVVDDTTITVASPPHGPGVIGVQVLDPAGASVALPFEYQAQAAIATSIDPIEGTELGGTPVTITGSGLLGATAVQFDGVDAGAFTIVDDTTITATTPAHAPGPSQVVVLDPAGNSAPLGFTFLAIASAITGIDPPEGPETGGTPVTITGSGFTGATAVEFDGVAGTTFAVVDDTTITVTTPAHAPGLAQVVVVDDPGGESAPFGFTFLAEASVADALDPVEGTELGDTPVTITGSGFLGATAVEFDGIPGTAFTVVDDTTITVTSPAHDPGLVGVVVVDAAGGDSAPLDYTYLADASVIEALDPIEGPEIGGTPVTITGSGFTGATAVGFDGLEGTDFEVVDDTTITVVTPAHDPGPVEVQVIDEAGGDSAPAEFTYLAEAALATALDPIEGTELGGTPVTITGSGFTGATAVEFDEVAGTAFTVVDDTTITVTTPPHAPGLVGVVVIDDAGDSAALDYTYLAVASVIDAIDPVEGTEAGGTPVTITGSGFTGATGVEFDESLGTTFSVVNDTTITVTTPPHAPGLVEVVVVDDAGGNSAPIGFTYLAVAAAATSITPDEGSEAGGTPVTITGSGFLGATGVEFDGAAGTAFTVVDDTTITVTTPLHAPALVAVVVLDPAGDSDPIDFTFVADAAEATSIAPAIGPSAGGTPVTITGTGFIGATGVEFDGVPGTAFVVVNDTTITVTTPPNDAGLAEVIVLDPTGDSAPIVFEYDAEPSIAESLTPTEGSEIGGTPVTITGSGFIGATGVEFDGLEGTGFTVVNDTTITVTSPAHDPEAVGVVVIDPTGNSGPLGFEYVSDASVLDTIDPTEGPESGGTPVTLTGSGFTGATAVEFNGIPGTDFVVVDDGTITVVTPAGTLGTAEVVVVDELGGDSNAIEFEFVAVAADATTIDPAEGPVVGGTPVTISGTGFTGATGVEFGGVAGTAFVVVDDTTITVASPPNDEGVVGVIVLDPEGDSEPIAFEYLAQAAIATSLTPVEGSELGGTPVTITGSGFLGATAVEFDGLAGTAFTVVDDTTITVLSPEHEPALVGVVVVDAAGNSAPLEYTYLAIASAITAIDPAEGPEIGGTPVTLTGSGFTGATGVTFDGLDGTEFVVVDDETITVNSPAHAPGLVDVVVADAAGGNSGPVGFTYLAEASAATSINPIEGSELGGTPVTITGTGFLGATGVEFDELPGTAFTVVDDTTITVTTPAHGPGVADVVVIDADGGDSAPIGFEFLAVAATATAIDPTEGPVVGGTPVTITGTGFTGATAVEFDGIEGTEFVVVNDTTITVTSPAHDPGLVAVVVIDEAGGDSGPVDFTYLAQAAVATSITPIEGPELGGTPVTITGSGFLGATAVEFDGLAGTAFTIVDDTTITVTTPEHAPGPVEVVVIDAAGNSAALEFSYLSVISVVDAIDPAEGPETGGTPVTLTGSGFTGATSVEFDGIAGTEFVVVDDTTITVTTPAHLPEVVGVVVVDVEGGDSLPVEFTYLAVAADATSIVPNTGSEAGGEVVTITGTGFLGATGVEFDGVAGTAFTVVNDTTITVTTPLHAPALIGVVVLDDAGDSDPIPFEFVAVGATATSIAPSSGPSSGGTPVTITGTGFIGATGVEFDGVPATGFVVVNDTTITATSPANDAGLAEVVVLDPEGDSDPIVFEYDAEASVATALDPAEGSELGGTPVTITGSGFIGATAVEFDGTPGSAFTVVNDTTITVTSPAHEPGLIGVVVVDPTGSSDPLEFNYLSDAAVLDTIAPAEGPETGGTPVTLTGSGFTGATAVEFGGVPGTGFVVVDDTTITVTTPAGAPGPVDVVVIDELGGDSNAIEFEFQSVPSAITTIAPAEGSEAGGTPVTLTGSGFTGATAVEFDGLLGTAFTVVNDTTITVTTPAHGPGLVGVVVVDDAAGGDSDPVDFTYLAVGAVATSVAPDSGSEAGGTPVTITGSGFLGATGVEFDGVAGTAFVVVNDTTITVTSPAHAPDVVGVVVLDPVADSDPLEFEYTADAADATSLDPTSGSEAGGDVVTITGSGFLGATGVEFDGTAGTAFSVVNDTTITVTTPAHAAAVVGVVVLDPSGDSDPLEFEYIVVAAELDTIAPAEGPENGGTPVTVTGSGFTGATAVEFNGIPGTEFVVVNDTTITVTTPPGAPGTAEVVVVDEPGGNSNAIDFEFLAVGADATTIAPAEGPVVGGTPVTITGTGFTGATGVEFGGVPGTEFEVVNDTTITVTSPPNDPGVVGVVVLDPEANSDPIEFEYLGQGALATALDPAEGTELGGTPVTITGSGFLGATGVEFGGVAGIAFEVVDDGTITVTTPASATGPGIAPVVVLDPVANSAPLEFIYLAVDSVVEAIDPAEGPESGGTPVTLTGSGFTGATGVTFDGVDGTEFVVVDDETITVVTPAHLPETVAVVVVDELGGDSDPVEFTYLAVAADATSLTPVDGTELGGTPVTITGTGFLGATAVEFDDVEGADFVVVNDTTITVTSPAHEPGLVGVVVVDLAGDSEALDFTYLAVGSVVDTITPAEGPEVGGTPVTLGGSGFTGATGATFGGVPGVDFVVVNDTTITVTSPPGAPGVVDVVVEDEAGGDSEPVGFEYLAESPVVEVIDPDEGSESGGTAVTLTGSGFTGATAVEFDGTAGTEFTLVDDTTITVVTPAHAPATVDVVVIDDAGGNSAAYDFTYLPAPADILAIDPDQGPEHGGIEVTIMGTGFTGASSVEFDGIEAANFTVWNDTMITVTQPPHPPAEDEDVVVLDDAGDDIAVFDFFVVAADPETITPSSGSELGGTQVTITGSGFVGATAVEFDDIPGTAFVVVDDNTITVTSPPHAAGVINVRVIDQTGVEEPLAFEYVAGVPAPNSIDPTFGPESGGTVVTIGGAGFVGATGVTFDGIPGTDFEVVNDTSVIVTTPVHVPGIAVVVVQDPAGDSDEIGFLFVAEPSAATSIDPDEGTEAGGTPVTITGDGFLGATAVEFDGIAGSQFVVVDDETITVTTPAHAAGLVGAVVIDAAGNSAPLEYLYLAVESVVDTIDPVEGPEAGGTAVTLTGSGFIGATAVEFDGIPGTAFTVVNDTTITVLSPPHAPEIVGVVVIDEPGGDSDPVEFEFLAIPSDATSIVPNSGSEAGGTAVTLTGTGFLGATGVEFDGIPGTAFTVVNDTTITVTTPAHEPDLIGVVVLDPAGDSEPLAFEFVPVASAATALDPAFGPAVGGTSVTVTGSGFLGATGVEFDGIAGTEFTVVDDTTITVTSPPHPSGLVDVVVLDPAGDSGPLDFEYDPQPSAATSITPVIGSEAGGTAVTITGTGFTGSSGVTFDGIDGTGFTVVDDTTITVTSPAHEPGPVDVIVVDATGSSDPLEFTYFALASITGIDPATGPEAGGTTVTITGTCFTGATAVRFGDVEVTDFDVSLDGTTITVVSPSGVGLVDVAVVGSAECGTATVDDGFAYQPAPSVFAAISPTRGPSTGGTPVTITGSGFTGATGVTFGGAAGRLFTIVNDTTITVETPATAPSTVEVLVLDPAGNAVAAFEFYAAAQIDDVTPGSGPVGGNTSVQIVGQCFTGVTEVRFGSTPAKSFTVNAAGTVITAVTPAGTGTVDITVLGTGDCGSVSLPDAFDYVTPGIPPTGVSITAGLWAAILLLVGGAAVLLIRHRSKSHKTASK
jgi:hypothetical protein